MKYLSHSLKPFIISLFLVSSAGFVLAQGNRPVNDNRPDLPDQAEARQADQTERMAERFELILARIVAKLENRVIKYQEFMAKIDVVRTELAEQGGDITELSRQYRLAEDDIVDVKANVRQLKDTIYDLDFSQGTPTQVLSPVLEQINQLRSEFRQLHQTVTDLVVEIGNIRQTLEE